MKTYTIRDIDHLRSIFPKIYDAAAAGYVLTIHHNGYDVSISGNFDYYNRFCGKVDAYIKGATFTKQIERYDDCSKKTKTETIATAHARQFQIRRNGTADGLVKFIERATEELSALYAA